MIFLGDVGSDWNRRHEDASGLIDGNIYFFLNLAVGYIGAFSFWKLELYAYVYFSVFILYFNK